MDLAGLEVDLLSYDFKKSRIQKTFFLEIKKSCVPDYAICEGPENETEECGCEACPEAEIG